MEKTNYLGKKGYTIKKGEFTQSQLYELRKELHVKPNTGMTGYGVAVTYPIYRESTNKIYIPRYFGIEKFGETIQHLSKNFKVEKRRFSKNSLKDSPSQLGKNLAKEVFYLSNLFNKKKIKNNIFSQDEKDIFLIHKVYHTPQKNTKSKISLINENKKENRLSVFKKQDILYEKIMLYKRIVNKIDLKIIPNKINSTCIHILELNESKNYEEVIKKYAKYNDNLFSFDHFHSYFYLWYITPISSIAR